jgi:D-glycero-D-manno-heptose 1,7-bisphosphate phosphatase
MYYEDLDRLACPADDAIAVGDSLRDLQGAQAAGIRAALVRTGNGRKTVEQATAGVHPLPADTTIYDDLAAFARAQLA